MCGVQCSSCRLWLVSPHSQNKHRPFPLLLSHALQDSSFLPTELLKHPPEGWSQSESALLKSACEERSPEGGAHISHGECRDPPPLFYHVHLFQIPHSWNTFVSSNEKNVLVCKSRLHQRDWKDDTRPVWSVLGS